MLLILWLEIVSKPKYKEIGGSTQSADQQKGKGGVVIAYLVDLYELRSHL
jgi:hypothetical protein